MLLDGAACLRQRQTIRCSPSPASAAPLTRVAHVAGISGPRCDTQGLLRERVEGRAVGARGPRGARVVGEDVCEESSLPASRVRIMVADSSEQRLDIYMKILVQIFASYRRSQSNFSDSQIKHCRRSGKTNRVIPRLRSRAAAPCAAGAVLRFRRVSYSPNLFCHSLSEKGRAFRPCGRRGTPRASRIIRRWRGAGRGAGGRIHRARAQP